MRSARFIERRKDAVVCKSEEFKETLKERSGGDLDVKTFLCTDS